MNHYLPHWALVVAPFVCVASGVPAAHAQSSRDVATTRLSARIEPRPSDTWLFGRIQDLTVDGSGRVYVLDATDQKVRVFSASGAPLRVIGGRGRGPGELFRPRTIEVVNDTLWVIDNANARLSAFSLSSGAYLRTSRAAVYDQNIEAVSQAGIFLVDAAGPENPSPSNPLTRRVIHERRVKQDRRQIASASDTRRSLVFRLYAGAAKQPFATANTTQPLDNGSLMRASPRGRSFFILHRIPPTNMRLLEISWNGDTLRSQTITVPTRTLSTADVAAVVDSLAHPNAIINGVTPVGVEREIRDSLYVPAQWPAVTELFAGIDGSVWLRQPQPPGKTAMFWRRRPDGKDAAPVAVPSGLRPFRVSLTRVWGVAENALGEPVVEVHDVVASAVRR